MGSSSLAPVTVTPAHSYVVASGDPGGQAGAGASPVPAGTLGALDAAGEGLAELPSEFVESAVQQPVSRSRAAALRAEALRATERAAAIRPDTCSILRRVSLAA